MNHLQVGQFFSYQVIGDLIGNNNSSIANCMVYLAKKKVINLKMAQI
jgi:hypothetical protein